MLEIKKKTEKDFRDILSDFSDAISCHKNNLAKKFHLFIKVPNALCLAMGNTVPYVYVTQNLNHYSPVFRKRYCTYCLPVIDSGRKK